MTLPTGLILSLLLAGACSTNQKLAVAPDADLGADAWPAPDAGPSYEEADWLFEADHLLQVDIQTSASNWDQLRFQTRGLLDIFGPECGQRPAVSPFRYVSATVTVDGIEVQNVGIRKKGFLGSLSTDKPSLKIKFNEYVSGQRLSGTKRLTLNNAKQDPSYMNQCLGYELFRKAGVPAPRCNFASLRVNGRDLGVYVNVESVKKPMLARHFEDNDGNLYEGTLSDFRSGWDGSFERKTNKADVPGSEDQSDIQAVVEALTLDDESMYAALDTLIDLEEFYSFWAIETMISHHDGYTGNNNNNYFVYSDPQTGKFSFLPWGADTLFDNATSEHDPAMTQGIVARRLFLHEPSRIRYLERYEEILDSVWSDQELLAEIERMRSLIAAFISADETEAFSQQVATLRSAITGRAAILRDNLSNAGPADAEALGLSLCFANTGSGSVSFTGAYGEQSETATTSMTLNGSAVTLSDLQVFVGADEDTPDHSVVFLVGIDDIGREAIVFLKIPDSLVGPGVFTVGSAGVEGALLFTPPDANDADELFWLGGTLNLSSAGLTVGNTWQGSLELNAWEAPSILE